MVVFNLLGYYRFERDIFYPFQFPGKHFHILTYLVIGDT